MGSFATTRYTMRAINTHLTDQEIKEQEDAAKRHGVPQVLSDMEWHAKFERMRMINHEHSLECMKPLLLQGEKYDFPVDPLDTLPEHTKPVRWVLMARMVYLVVAKDPTQVPLPAKHHKVPGCPKSHPDESGVKYWTKLKTSKGLRPYERFKTTAVRVDQFFRPPRSLPTPN